MKLLVSVFERAKSKITSTHSNGRISSGLFKKHFFSSIKFFRENYSNIFFFRFLDSDNESDTNTSRQIFSTGPSIIHQQPRSSLSKWLCTNPSSIDKSVRKEKKKIISFSHLISHDTFFWFFNNKYFQSNNLHIYKYIQLFVS